MKWSCLILLMCLSLHKALSAENRVSSNQGQAFIGGILLKSPPLISNQTLEEKIRILPMSMVWNGKLPDNQGTWSLGFEYQNREATVTVQFLGLFPDSINSDIKEKFIKTIENDQETWTYFYGNVTSPPSKQLSQDPSQENIMGSVGNPLIDHGNPQHLTAKELAEKIRNKKTIFYTGAGISAGVVPTMPQIMERLALTPTVASNPLDLLKKILVDPKSYKKPMDDFYQACLKGQPTPAHTALKEIALLKNWGVLTENLDMLHQRSGIEPLNHLMPNWLKANIAEEDLKKIDVVVTVGLQSDESGFLGWYKRTNPKGNLIAINLQQPPYIGNDDFVLRGNAQVMLPELLKELKK